MADIWHGNIVLGSGASLDAVLSSLGSRERRLCLHGFHDRVGHDDKSSCQTVP